MSYRDNDNDQAGNSGRLRTRLFVNGTINEDWTYTGRFENNQYYHGEKENEYSGATGDDDIDLNWAYVSGRVGGVKVDAGRQNFKTHTGNVLDAEFDGAKLAYGEKVKLTGYVGKAADDVFDADALGSGDGLTSDDRLYIADLSAKIGVVDAYVSYYNVDNGFSQEIYNVGAALPVAKDLKLSAEWMYGTADEGDDGLDNNGWVAGLAYKGAKASKPGSWGVYANYYDMPAMTYLDNTNDGYNGVMNKWQLDGDGFEGYEVGANVALAKNIVAGVKYFDLEQREGSADEQAIWSEVVFTF